MNDFILHQSDLTAFFDCPARYYLSKRYRPLVPSDPLRIGGQAHKLLEGFEPEGLEPAAVRFYERLKRLEQDEGYVIKKREVHQQVRLTASIILDRRIDAIATTRDGLPVLIDYKTAKWGWDEYATPFGTLAPKAWGFQSAAYLIPGEHRLWPTRMDYLVAAENAKPKVFTYYRNKEDEDNLIAAAIHLAKTETFPKVRGHKCGLCDVRGPCLPELNWEERYSHECIEDRSNRAGRPRQRRVRAGKTTTG